jgi:hypothetical protein
MVIREPNSLPDDVKPKPHDANSAATVLNDVQMTEMPRGWALLMPRMGKTQ